ncbi:hypothetical protein ACET3Z_004921 [Daucus carota]
MKPLDQGIQSQAKGIHSEFFPGKAKWFLKLQQARQGTFREQGLQRELQLEFKVTWPIDLDQARLVPQQITGVCCYRNKSDGIDRAKSTLARFERKEELQLDMRFNLAIALGKDEADEFDEAMIVRFVRLQDTYRDRNHIEEVEFNRLVYFLSTLFAEKKKSDDDEEVDVVVVKVVVDEGVFSESVYEEEEYEEEALLICLHNSFTSFQNKEASESQTLCSSRSFLKQFLAGAVVLVALHSSPEVVCDVSIRMRS